MQSLKSRRPSPALVISLLALFVALGGSAYAASKIGTKNLKNGAVTAAKIKKNAVTGAKIKNGAVTGAKVDVSTLGTVPSAAKAAHATSADTATNAVNATNAATAANFSRYFTTGLKKSNGGNITLGTVGPFTFDGKCEDQGGGNFKSEVVVTTSAPRSYFYTHEFSDSSEGQIRTRRRRGTQLRTGIE